MAQTRSWTHDALLAAATGGRPPLLEAPGRERSWEDLARAAGRHGVLGWVARSLRGAPGVPPAFQLHLQAAALPIAANHRRLSSEAAVVCSLLHAAGADALVLKGPALVERHYDDDSLRSYGDIDVLVRPRAFGAALDALLRAGYLLADRNWDFLVRDLRGQVHLTSPSGAVVELHWHLVNGLRQRRTLRMTPEEMWEAAERGTLAGAPCFALRREDELAHLALHAAMHGCNRLVWLLDMAAVVRDGEVDWALVERRLRRWRFATGGGLVLALAAEWAGACVPDDVLRSLVSGRGTWAAYRAAVARWDLGDADGSQARELFFATAGDRPGARAALVADAIVPAAGQQPGRHGGLLYRASVGAFDRVRSKLFGTKGVDSLSEYVTVGDQEAGRRRFVDAVAATVPASPRRRVMLVSPSLSIGMSHYTRALALAVETAAEVEVLDAATGDPATAVVARWWRTRRSERKSTRVLVTSPHWSMPPLLRLTGWTGGFVWHDPILDAAGARTKSLHALYYRLITKRLGVVVLHGAVFTQHVTELELPAREVLVVPHGFVPDQLVADEPYDPAGPLVFVGRLHPYKGLHVLLDALERRDDPDPARVVIGGDGIRPELIPPHLRAVDVRPGELPDEELRGLIAACSAVLLPYERANQSGVLATAFRSGRPVIASRVGSFAEYVEDGVNGLLVPPGDAQALADAIARLRSDPDLARRLAAGASKTWEEELSPARWGREIVGALFR